MIDKTFSHYRILKNSAKGRYRRGVQSEDTRLKRGVAMQGRQSLFPKEQKEELYKYIAEIIRSEKQELLGINSILAHAHIFIDIKPGIALSDLTRDIKNNSSAFINEKKWIRGKFNW